MLRRLLVNSAIFPIDFRNCCIMISPTLRWRNINIHSVTFPFISRQLYLLTCNTICFSKQISKRKAIPSLCSGPNNLRFWSNIKHQNIIALSYKGSPLTRLSTWKCLPLDLSRSPLNVSVDHYWISSGTRKHKSRHYFYGKWQSVWC